MPPQLVTGFQARGSPVGLLLCLYKRHVWVVMTPSG